VRQALVHNEGLPPHRVEIVYNGVDVSAFGRDKVDRNSIRRELGVGDEEFIILQVARLDTIKDHATAVRAIAAALPRHPSIRLLIVGDGPERETIEQAITGLGLGHRVTMLGMRGDVRRLLLSAADAFLLTSVSEGIPVTILEAMAAGVPVVSTAVGGVPELIEHGKTGLLAPAGDAASLSESLVRLAGDDDLRRRLAAAAHQRAIARFSEAQMIGHYDRIYREMLAARVPAA